MKLTVEKDDGKIEVFQNITDLYIAVRYLENSRLLISKDGQFPVILTKSHSWGANIRDLVKELQQSLVELQDFLREQRNGNSS